MASSGNSTNSGTEPSSLGNIRIAFGQTVARELIEFSCLEGDVDLQNQESGTSARGGSHGTEAEDTKSATPNLDNMFAFRAKGYVSNANYNAKRSRFILFINDRLVESVAIKRTIDAVYKDILPNHTHPFVYLSIKFCPFARLSV